MEISPIDYRYGRTPVKEIFSREERLKMALIVEYAVLESRAELGLLDETIPKRLDKIISDSKGLISQIDAEEIKTRHDVMAMINVVSAVDPDVGKYLHMGMTSNDVGDTATALQIKSFLVLFVPALVELIDVLASLVKKYSSTVMLGRTHGQHASPITFGLKVSVFLAEMQRHCLRLIEAKDRILVGKIRGPVGTGAGMGPQALDVEQQTMNLLGLNVEENSSQVVGRDRLLELLFIFSNISVTLEKLATEIRNLQRPEIGEVAEGFEKKTQVGSSAMPSKQNPVDSENVCSLARLIRSFVTPEMEGAILWHERDLANSALERFTIPYSCILTDFIVFKMTKILRNVVVNESKMISNLHDDPLSMSESIVVSLTTNGIARNKAHEMVRNAAMASPRAKDFPESLRRIVPKTINSNVLEEALDPLNFTGSSRKICSDTLTQTRRIKKKLLACQEELVS